MFHHSTTYSQPFVSIVLVNSASVRRQGSVCGSLPGASGYSYMKTSSPPCRPYVRPTVRSVRRVTFRRTKPVFDPLVWPARPIGSRKTPFCYVDELACFFNHHPLSMFAVQLQCDVASMWPRDHVMYLHFFSCVKQNRGSGLPCGISLFVKFQCSFHVFRKFRRASRRPMQRYIHMAISGEGCWEDSSRESK